MDVSKKWSPWHRWRVTWLCCSPQSALRYPLSVIFLLTHKYTQFHPLSLSASPPPTGPPALITFCSYKNKTHRGKDVCLQQKMRRHRFIVCIWGKKHQMLITWRHQQYLPFRSVFPVLTLPIFHLSLLDLKARAKGMLDSSWTHGRSSETFWPGPRRNLLPLKVSCNIL